MPNGSALPLHGRRLLIVEDEYTIAAELAWSLEELGAEVIGPAPSVAEALALVETHGARLHAALLDINLRDARVYPVADALAAMGTPFVFVTGYDRKTVPNAYPGIPLLEKPVDRTLLLRVLDEFWAA